MTSNEQQAHQWVSIDEFARQHRLSKTFIYEQARMPDGPLMAVKVGGRWLIRRDSFDRLLDQRRAEVT